MNRLLMLALPTALLFAALQAPLPPALARHAQTLGEAGFLTATLSVQPSGGATETLKLTYSKPNLLRIERPGGMVMSDGQSVIEYDKASNTYSSSAATPEALAKLAEREEVLAWAAFFAKEPAKAYRFGKAGAKRMLKGNAVTEITASLGGSRQGDIVLFIDDKLGVARGFTLTVGEKQWTVIASEVQLGAALPSAGFAFSLPEGAKKAEEVKPAATFAQVQAIFNRACMPCHGPQQVSGGLLLNNYQGVLAGVVPGDPASSRIVRSLRASGPNRMPKNAPPLPPREIGLVEAWIQDGAKAQ
jgi:outer membrane lipoprotein-sorting protein